jgi:hypothetical protein
MDNTTIIEIAVGIIITILIIYIIYRIFKKIPINRIIKINLPDYKLYNIFMNGKFRWKSDNNDIVVRLVDENWIKNVHYFNLKIINNNIINKYNFKMDYVKNELSYNIDNKSQIIIPNSQFDLEKK